MPTTISESDGYPTTLQTPNANELASAPALASLFLQGIADRTNWIRRRLLGLGATPATLTAADEFTAAVQVPAASEIAAPNVFTRIAQPLANRTANLNRRLTQLAGGGATERVLEIPFGLWQLGGNAISLYSGMTANRAPYEAVFTSSSTDASIWLPVIMPATGVLNAAYVVVAGTVAFPSTRPLLQVIIEEPHGSTGLLASASDAAANAGQYAAIHTIAVTGMTWPINATGLRTRFWLRLHNEGSTAGLRVLGAYCGFTGA